MLVGLLWVLAILSVVVVGILHTASLDLRLAKNHGDKTQAYYLALAGLEKAKALLHHDAVDRRRTGKNHTGELYDSPSDFRDVDLGRGKFRVFHPGGRDDIQDTIYGAIDEGGLLNVNTASVQDLMKLRDMTAEVAAAIVDYRDSDSRVTQGGAEFDDYAAMKPPYIPHDGPFRTIRELLLVRGMPRDLLLGEDANANGLLDPEEDDGDGKLDAGWSGLLCIESSVANVDAKGEARINAQKASQTELEAVDGITTEIAQAMVQYRGQNEFKSLADLLDVRAMRQDPNANRSSRSSRNSRSSQSTPNRGGSNNLTPTGPNLISQELLIQIADSLTIQDETTLPGRVSINTAPAEVLELLPGMTAELARAIVDHRSSNGFFENTAALLNTERFSKENYKLLAPRITARAETFRILSEGKVTSTGARQRLLATVRVGPAGVDILSYREDL